MEKYNLILNAEQQFAREVTLGVIVTRPLTAWHYIIPGFFIIDFLRRGSAIKQYTKHFMFPRNLALDKAMTEMQGDDRDSIRANLEDNVRIWLESLSLFTQDLKRAHVALVEILAEHYRKLLSAEGDTFNLLIEYAYQNGDSFKQFIDRITAAENEIDRQVIEQLGGNDKVIEKICAEQQQIAKRRQKILEDVF